MEDDAADGIKKEILILLPDQFTRINKDVLTIEERKEAFDENENRIKEAEEKRKQEEEEKRQAELEA